MIRSLKTDGKSRVSGISLSVDGQVIWARIAIQDAPKASSKEAIKKLKERGLKTVKLTGGYERVARLLLSKWALIP